MLVPLGVDPARRLLLLPEGGPRLRESESDAGTWAAKLWSYSALQRDLGGRAEDLVALGVPDRRPELLPDLVADLLDDDGA